MKTAFLLCVAALLLSCTLHAQNCISSAQAGADDCAKACTYCALDGKTGSTAAYTSGLAPGFCAGADNDQWYGFIAGADSIVIQVTPAGCQNGNGIEIALYAACDAPPLACVAGQAGEGTAPRILEAALVPGQTYFLMIDGFEGDVCNFSIQTGPPDAVATPAIDPPGPVEGPSIVAAGSTHIYRIPPVANATAYTWTAPSGTKINGQTPFVTLPAPGGHQITVTYGSNQSGKICVKPVTSCGAGASSCLSVSTNGTLPPPCPAAGFPTADLCADICADCDFDGYTGNTSGYTGQTPPGFCGTIENEQWLGFVAGAPAATITVTPSNCATGNGVQIALYPSCGDAPLQCNSGSAGGGDTPLSITSALIPGVTYYLLIDGWAGDQCDFQVVVTPPGAGIAPVVGPTGILNGPPMVCPGSQATFSVPPVSGASAYLWDAPAGWLINGMPAPVTLVGAGANNVQVTVGVGVGDATICVQPVNSCSAGVPVCRNAAVQPLPPTAGAAVSGSLTCMQKTVTLDGSTNIANAQFQWSGPGGFLSSLEDPVVEIPGEYILTVIDPASGCSSQAVVEAPADTVSPAASPLVDTITCLTEGIFIGVADPDGYHFAWAGPNGFTSDEAGFHIALSELGIYSVTITNPSNGCTQTLQVSEFIQNQVAPGLAALSVVNDQLGQQIGAIDIQITYPGSTSIIWYKNGVPYSVLEDISGLAAGIYTVVVTANDNGCSATLVVEVVNITVSTGAAPGAGTYWDLFPNPAHSYLHLRYRGGGIQPEARVSIIDVTGRYVFLQTVLTSTSEGIPLGHLPPGMYRLQIQTEKTTVWKAIAIQH